MKVPAGAVSYFCAIAIGSAAIAYTLPLPTLDGSGGVFANPPGDLPTNLIGHLALQVPGWHWPVLRAPILAVPNGASIAMTDSNALLTLLAKIIASLRGRPANLFGLWLALCCIAQPVSAVYALRGFLNDSLDRLRAVIAAIAAGVFSLLMPILLFRVVHINLLAQFVLLISLGLASRWSRSPHAPPMVTAFVVLLVTILIHPYLFMFCAAILCAPGVQSLIAHDPAARAALRTVLAAAMASVAIYLLLSGSTGGGGPGYGVYSLNLAGPFTPQISGLFGADRPVVDATGYQREAFNYLGAGVLFLLLAAGALAARAGGAACAAAMARRWGILAVLAALTALAITPRVTFGTATILALPMPGFDHLFNMVRASGRAFWPVAYALMLGSLAVLATVLPARSLAFVLTIAIGLQWADTAPLRAGARDYLAGRDQTVLDVKLPEGMLLFSTSATCGDESVLADSYRLAALRAGAQLAATRLARDPPAQVCAATRLAALHDPLLAGEVRYFPAKDASAIDRVALGQGAIWVAAGQGWLCSTAKVLNTSP